MAIILYFSQHFWGDQIWPGTVWGACVSVGLPGVRLSGKEPACRCRRPKRHGFDPGSGRSPGGGHGNPLQYSCLENPTDRGGWGVTVHGATKTRTQLSDFVHMRVNMYSLCHVCKTEKLVAIYETDDHMDWYIFIVIQKYYPWKY